MLEEAASNAVRANVLVVGSGPSGLALTDSLLHSGVAVTLVPGGSLKETPANRDRRIGEAGFSTWNHEPLDKYRRFEFGGAGNAWGGRCVLLDQEDFDHRPWIPFSGWPISYDEYLGTLDAACDFLQVSAPPHHSEDVNLWAIDQSLERSGLKNSWEVWSNLRNFRDYRAELGGKEKNLTIIDDGWVSGINISEVGRVNSATVTTPTNKIEVHPNHLVLATGAIENARLLMISRVKPGLPALGRFYQSHLWLSGPTVNGPALSPDADFFKLGQSFVRRRWRTSYLSQQSYAIGNGSAAFSRPSTVDLSTQNPGSRESMKSPLSFGVSPTGFRYNMADSMASFRAFLGRRMQPKATRPPLAVPTSYGGPWSLTMQLEHAPNWSSQVSLSDQEFDLDGNPRPVVAINFSDLDIRTIRQTYGLLRRDAIRHGRTVREGSRIESEMLEQYLKEKFDSNAHQLGTTRMGLKQNFSVVSPEQKVHGTKNLWVTGTSVMPTSGHANPTLTAVMLSIRLAQHLTRQC